MFKMLRFGWVLGAFLAAVYLPSSAWAQSAADPTLQTPIGVVTKPEAKGPSLTGVVVVEFLNSDLKIAYGARLSVRLRRGKMLRAFFARIPDDVVFDIETPEDTQNKLIAALRNLVLGEFFPDACGMYGDECPEVGVVLKRIEEYAQVGDGDQPGVCGPGCAEGQCDPTVDGTSLYVIANVVVSTTEPL